MICTYSWIGWRRSACIYFLNCLHLQIGIFSVKRTYIFFTFIFVEFTDAEMEISEALKQALGGSSLSAPWCGSFWNMNLEQRKRKESLLTQLKSEDYLFACTLVWVQSLPFALTPKELCGICKVNSDESDQSAQMRSLIRVFAFCTC